MYFSSRLQAGRSLAKMLYPKFRYENCAAIALNNGGVSVGLEIARELHCVLNLLIIEEISLPREPLAIGAINSEGTFSYNDEYSAGTIEELSSEYRGYIEENKTSSISRINKIVGSGGTINKDLLKGRNIILVGDGFDSTLALDMAYQFLKPIAIEKLIVATPLASVKVVDWMHVYADEIYCLSVIEDYINTDHYYDKKDVLKTDDAIKVIDNIVLHWK